LNTQPEILLDWLEDEALGELIEEVDDDEWLIGAENFYQSYVRR
jgi:hypothetical protein